MNLVNLSGDILAQIARLNDTSVAIIALWKCGDAAMNKKIGNWVDSIDLEDQNLASKSRYPKFLSSLHKLRVLRLVRPGRLAPNTVLSAELQKLSLSLTELTISADTADEVFLDYPASQLGRHVDLSKCIMDDYWNIGLTFPSLIKLALKRTYHQQMLVFIKTDITATLPASLEHLEFQNGITPMELDLSHLPALHTLKSAQITDHLAPWPSTLTRLDGCFYKQKLPPDFYETLPRTLTTAPGFETFDSSLALQSQFPLPPSLTELHLPRLQELPPSFFPWIPPMLTTLVLNCKHGPLLNATDLLALPPGLTYLEVRGIDWTDILAYSLTTEDVNFESFWPRKLRHCIFRPTPWAGSAVVAGLMNALPPSLTEIIGFYDWKSAHFDLQRNSLPNLNALSLKGDVPLRHAPTSTLTRLDLIITDFRSGLDIFQTTTALTYLRLDIAQLLVFEAQRLGPKVITKLNLADLMQSLPQNLKTLEICFQAALPSEWITWSPKAWSHLPSTLTYLSVHCWLEHAPTPSTVLPFLPPNLKRLKLCLSELPSIQDVLDMPCYHQLRSIKLYHLSRFTEASVSELESIWPENAVGDTIFKGCYPPYPFPTRVAFLMQRNKQYPDPRVMKPSTVEKARIKENQSRALPTSPSPLKIAKRNDSRFYEQE